MSKPLIDLNDDSLFNSPSSGGSGQRGIRPAAPLAPAKIDLNDDSLFYKSKEEAGADVALSRFRSLYGYDEPVEAKPAKRGLTGVLSDLGSAVFEGTKSTGRSLGAAGNTITGDLADVERYGEAQRAAASQGPEAKRALLSEIERRKQADPNPSVVSAIRNVGSAMLENPEGAAQFVAEQAPNTVVSLGAGVAGAKTGALAGAAFGPVGSAIGGVAGFLGGMFLGNFMLETGGNAIEKSAGGFTPDERSEALKEGAIKGGVITAVDAATLGAGGKLAKTLNKAAIEAGAKAEAKVLADAGVDLASRAAVEKALANPTLRASAKEAGKAAAKQASTVGSKAAAAGTGIALETVGEGTGEYLGELAATGEADVYGAVLEAAAGLTQSVPETAYNISQAGGNNLDARGIQRAQLDPAKPPAPPGKTQQTQQTQGLPLTDDRLGSDERPPMSWLEVSETLQTNPGVLAVLSADAKTPEERDMVQKAIARSEIGDRVEAILNDPQQLNDARAEMQSELYQPFVADLLASLPMYANEMPPGGITKFKPRELGRQQQLDEMTQSPEYLAQLQEEADRFKAEREARQMSMRKPPASDAPVTDAPAGIGGDSAPAGLPATAQASTTAEQSQTSNQRMALLEAHFSDEFSKIRGKTGVTAQKRAANLRAQMARQGMSEEDIQRIEAGDTPPDMTAPLFSKSPNGRIKAAFFKDLKKVYYSAFTWKGGLSSQQRRALELHEVGAHYAVERMLGSDGYSRLLSDLRAMRGKDKTIDAAYASVPTDTPADQVDHEALGYLIENYENNSFVRRFIQMVADWYKKTFKGQTLTASDLRALVRSAYNTYGKEIKRVYLRENISDVPAPNAVRLDFQQAINSSPEAHRFLDFISQFRDDVTLSGSLAISAQAAIYRQQNQQIHDLDFRVADKDRLPAILEAVAKAYPNSGIYNKFASRKTNSDVVAITLDKDNKDALTVDFFTKLDQRSDFITDDAIEKSYTGADGKERTLRLNTFDDIFGKKLAMNRAKDVSDFLMSGNTGAALSREQPAPKITKADEIAYQKVLEHIRAGKLELANRVHKTQGLFAKGMGSFSDMLTRASAQPAQEAAPAPAQAKDAPAPAPSTKKAPEPAPAPEQVTGPDDADIAEMSFVSAPERPKARRERPAKPAPAREQLLMPFGPPPGDDTWAMTKLRERLDGIVKNASSIKFFQDTIIGLEQQIADVESQLRSLDKIEVDGKTFTRVNEDDEAPGLWGIYDENAYDRFADGFVPDKPGTRQELLAARRKLAEELTKVRENSIAAKARLFKRSISRMADQMMNATRSAINGGMPEADARKVFNDYYQAISFRETRAEETAESLIDLPPADIQSDMFDGVRTVIGLIYDAARPTQVADKRSAVQIVKDSGGNFPALRAPSLGASALSQLNGFIEQGLRDGDFTFDDVVTGFRAVGMDIPRGVLDVSSQLAVRKPLAKHLQEAGHSTASRMEWLVSMDKVLSVKPGARGRFTAEELALHDNVFAKREELRKRRKVDESTVAADNADDAFPGLLFNNYTLAEASKDKTLNKWLQGNGREAWMEDVAFALRSRPDLSDEILTNLGEDRTAFDAWVQQKKDAIAKESEVLAKVPAFAEIRNMDYAEQVLTSVPVNNADINAGAEDTRPSELERLYVTVANSEMNELPSVMDAVAKVRALMTSGIDMETGEIFQSQAEAEAAAAEYIDSVFQRSMMAPSARSDLGAKFMPDEGFGMTVEMAGERDLGLPGQIFDTDQSLEELQNAGLVTEADVEGMSSLDAPVDEEADAEADNNSGSQDEPVADSRERSPRPVNVPTSLVGPEQYRFRKGFFSGNLVPAVVSEHLNKIAAKWPGAPNMVIVPNVQSLPAELREKVMAKLGSQMYAKGLYFNGDVYIFTDHAESLADAEFTLFHEVEGHFGMRAFMGADFDAYLERLYKTNPDIRRAADARMNEEPMGRLEAVDEVLSDMQMAGQNSGMFQAYVGKLIAGLRKIGMERVANWIASQGNFEVAYLLRGAKQAVRRGDRPSVGAPDDLRLASTRTPYELFSARDGKTVAYARYNPVLDRWSIFTATGPDIRNGFNTAIEGDFEKVVTTMRKMGRVERRMRSGVYVDNKIPSDLAKIPDFRIASEDINFTSKEGLKTAWSLVKRNAAISLQNEYIPVFEVVNHLERQGKINPAYDVRGDLEGLYERRTGAKLEKYRKQFEKPLMKLVEQLGKEGGNTTLGEAFPSLAASFKDSRLANLSVIDAYLGARHAAERNKQIASINPNQPDGGSGIFTSDADLILNTLSREKYGNTLAEMTHILKDISDLKLAEMYDSGMIDRKELEARSQYKYYVNLSGINENIDQFDNPVILAGGPKFGTRKDRRAMGRGDAASDILIRTLQSFEAAVIHAEKNKVKQKVLAMFEINYDPDFVVINKQATVRKLDENGQVTEATDDRYLQNRDVMIVHVRGKPVTMEFKQKGPGSFAEAINGMIWPPEATNWFQRFSGRANQLMGQMLTTWNPAWTAVNYVRDLQNLYFNAVTEGRITRDMAKQMVKLQPQAIKAAFHIATDGKRGQSARQDMLDAYIEMRDVGGATSFLNLRGLEQQVQELEKLMNPNKPGSLKDVVVKMADMVEAINIPMEMAPRIAAFKVMRDNGYSAEEAARFAGDITVNFNMRGSSKFMRNMFLFFNPAVQGANKMYRLAKDNPKTMTKIALGMAAAGFISNIIARALGGEDDDGIDKLDKVPVFKRATSIVLWPDMPGMSIPIPYGWNAFYAAGTFMADTLWAGSQSASTTAKRIAGTAFESFSPLGGAMLDASSTGVGVLKAVTPTVLSPLVDLVLNENRFGAPITKEASMFGGGKRADSHMNFDSASPISTAALRGLNKLTGGDKVESGLIDINPGALDYLVSGYLPGIAAETYKFASWSVRKAQGYDTKDAALPIIDRLTAKVPEGYNFGMLRRAETFIKTKVDDYEINKDKRADILKEHPNLGVAKSIIGAVDSQIGSLRQARNQLEQADIPEEKKVELYNLSRQREKEIVAKAVRLLLQTNPQMREVLLAND